MREDFLGLDFSAEGLDRGSNMLPSSMTGINICVWSNAVYLPLHGREFRSGHREPFGSPSDLGLDLQDVPRFLPVVLAAVRNYAGREVAQRHASHALVCRLDPDKTVWRG